MKQWSNFTWEVNQFSVKLGGEVRHFNGRVFGQMQVLGFKLQDETNVARRRFELPTFGL
ncbi:DUF4172 domain-containing protein [Parasediminibacterium sp. JCM 36343]|uniref:DUF4172 domain-containing protein n=1 Tax=Parasediminibacterium sp. JCM 36343 TaxID=3374279 RepID=UPI0039793023